MKPLSILDMQKLTRNVLCLYLLYSIVKGTRNISDYSVTDPYFAEPIPNVTIIQGRNLNLPCVVENLGHYRVAWIHAERHILLSIQNRVIIRNERYRVSHSRGSLFWYLHINNVQESDRGQYMCQINTTPMKSQVGHVEVVAPPQIDESQTSSDIDVVEGNEAHLKCSAKGYPEPEIKWRREDGLQFNIHDGLVHTYNSEQLDFSHVNRQHMGSYLCIAHNGVPPSVSKRITLTVNFPPMIWIPNQLIGAHVGSDAVLECNLEAHPKSITFWSKVSGLHNVQQKIRQSFHRFWTIQNTNEISY